LAADADGVHLGQTSFPVIVARQLLGAGKLIGVSTHNAVEIAAATGADFIVFGPVYVTPSKVVYGEPQGLARLRQAVLQSPLPVVAIGGITAKRVAEVLATGAQGVAVISVLSAASDPAQAARALLAKLS
jgi:thiamine-phosphate pyrophosphorylase